MRIWVQGVVGVGEGVAIFSAGFWSISSKFIPTSKTKFVVKTTASIWSSYVISWIVFEGIYKIFVFFLNKLADLINLKLLKL